MSCKGELAEKLNEFLRPVRERRADIDPAGVDAILEDGTQRARAVAKETLAEVKSAMHLA